MIALDAETQFDLALIAVSEETASSGTWSASQSEF